MDAILARLTRLTGVTLFLLLAGCGGGGGGSGSSSSSAPQTSFTVSTTTINVTAPLNRNAPTASFTVTAQNIPDDGLYYSIAHTEIGIATNGISESISDNTMTVQAAFQTPLTLGIGSYSDVIRISLCYDSACTQLVTGSPYEVSVQYEVTEPDSTIALDLQTTSVSAFITEPIANAASFYTFLENMPIEPGFYEVTSTSLAINQLNVSVSGGQGFVYAVPKSPSDLGPGAHTDTITITACWDAACTMPLANSPLTVPVMFTISDSVAGSEGYTVRLAQDIAARTFDADDIHNTLVVGASASSGTHANSLVSIDPTSGLVVNSISLGTEPNIVDASNDGAYAYVGFASANQVKRYALSNFSLDSTISLGTDASLGPLYAADLQVSPADGQQVTVIARPSGTYTGKLSVFSGSTEQASYSNASESFNIVRWGNNTQLFMSSTEISPSNLLELTVSGNAITETSATSGLTNYENFIVADGLIYFDGGRVYDPASQAVLGRFGSGTEDIGVVAVDTNLGRAYFMSSGQIRVYDLTSRTLLRSTQLPGISYIYHAKLIRWGTDGLAFADGEGRLIILDGPFVTE